MICNNHQNAPKCIVFLRHMSLRRWQNVLYSAHRDTLSPVPSLLLQLITNLESPLRRTCLKRTYTTNLHYLLTSFCDVAKSVHSRDKSALSWNAYALHIQLHNTGLSRRLNFATLPKPTLSGKSRKTRYPQSPLSFAISNDQSGITIKTCMPWTYIYTNRKRFYVVWRCKNRNRK